MSFPSSSSTEKSANTSTVEILLARTKLSIESGDRDRALASLINAIALTKGPDAIIDTLNQAKQRAEAEASQQAVYDRALLEEAQHNSKRLVRDDSILKDRQESTILRDAFEDGSSVICVRCKSLIKRTRWNAHRDLWCPELDNAMMSVVDLEQEETVGMDIDDV